MERTSLIQSYDYSGKCLFHLHQTVIPKYIIIVMKQEEHSQPRRIQKHCDYLSLNQSLLDIQCPKIIVTTISTGTGPNET